MQKPLAKATVLSAFAVKKAQSIPPKALQGQLFPYFWCIQTSP
jgi:hypothetical protein